MKYISGFILAFILIYLFEKFQAKHNILQERKIKPIRYSQIHEAKNNIKVIIMDNMAYWIKDNALYVADMSIDGTVNKETTRRVDTMTMNRVQLDKMIFIIDKLREGTLDDSGSAG
jgi:hypothetical protein